jgi:hypothetical protein
LEQAMVAPLTEAQIVRCSRSVAWVPTSEVMLEGGNEMHDVRAPGVRVLRVACCIDGLVFLLAASLNFGLQISFSGVRLYFPDPIWQAGIGEAVIGLTLLVAGITGRRSIIWVAFWLSVFGIAFGLASARVQGLAREIHVVLVPLSLVVFGLLLWLRQRQARRTSAALEQGGVQ